MPERAPDVDLDAYKRPNRMAEYADGTAWRFTAAEVVELFRSGENLRMQAYSYAGRNRLKARTRTEANGDMLLQFRPEDGNGARRPDAG